MGHLCHSYNSIKYFTVTIIIVLWKCVFPHTLKVLRTHPLGGETSSYTDSVADRGMLILIWQLKPSKSFLAHSAMEHNGVCMVISCGHLNRMLDSGMLSFGQHYSISVPTSDERLTMENLQVGFGKLCKRVYLSSLPFKRGRISRLDCIARTSLETPQALSTVHVQRCSVMTTYTNVTWSKNNITTGNRPFEPQHHTLSPRTQMQSHTAGDEWICCCRVCGHGSESNYSVALWLTAARPRSVCTVTNSSTIISYDTISDKNQRQSKLWQMKLKQLQVHTQQSPLSKSK